MEPIFLIGFMGSGKSTIGRCLAGQLGCRFMDTDTYFEEKEQMEISMFFSKYGENAFRDKEEAYLKLCTQAHTVIATGGGIILRQENIDWMRENGTVVYLQSSFAQICNRLQDDQTRPLFQMDHLEDTKARLESRKPLYHTAAHYIVDTEKKSPMEIVEDIQKFICV